MKKTTKTSLYILGGVTALAGLMFLLWQHATIDIETTPLRISSAVGELFDKPKLRVKRDPFVYRQAIRSESKKSSVEIVAPPPQKMLEEPTLQMQYVGTLVRDGIKMAFILHQDNKFVVRVGDFVAATFRVTGIEDDYVSLHKEPEGKLIKLYMSGSAQ